MSKGDDPKIKFSREDAYQALKQFDKAFRERKGFCPPMIAVLFAATGPMVMANRDVNRDQILDALQQTIERLRGCDEIHSMFEERTP
jgi:hypothetical protein